MSFTNAFVSNAVCCPSRATIMRGQYSHNNGVWTNGGGPKGGWGAYKANGNERDNVAYASRQRRLQDRPHRQVPERYRSTACRPAGTTGSGSSPPNTSTTM
jgi:hypothetical protein